MQQNLNPHFYVVIMAGGVGSRFWPGSRESRPKQFLDMLGTGRSLLRATYERFLPICPPDRMLVVTNAAYQNLTAEHLPELPAQNILCEPSRNNTAPCIAYAALRLRAMDPQACFVVASSDHLVQRETFFLEKINQAVAFVSERDALATIGITPTRPDTGYGYIRCGSEQAPGVFQVAQFLEKPDRQTAERFVASGDYVWNAGIFVWSAQTILRAYRRLAPQILEVLEAQPDKFGTDAEQDYIDQVYPNTPGISVDYAIMERADNVYVLPADIGWSDLGTWASLYEVCEKDGRGNVLQGDALIITDTEDCMIRSQHGKLTVLRDLRGYIVVDTPDALLIYPKSKEQEIRQVVAAVKEKYGGSWL